MTKTRKFIRYAVIMSIVMVALVLASCDGTTNLLEVLDANLKEAFGLSEYELTISASGNGTVTPSGTLILSESDEIDITASADGGYGFLRWEKIGGAGTAAFGNVNQAVTIVSLRGGNASIHAVFTADSYRLTVEDDGNGSTTPAGMVDVNHGTPRSINAVPGTGYDFAGWTVISGSADFDDANTATTTVTLTAGDATVRANFVLKTYTLTVTNDGNGANTPSVPVTVQHNTARSIYASPNRFRSFDGWVQTGGGGTASFTDSLNRTTQVRVTGGDVTIRARFKTTGYSLTRRGDILLNTSGYLNSVNDMKIDGNYLYLGGTTYAGNGAVMKLDVSSKSNPIVVETRTTASGGSVTGIAIAGTRIWAADIYNGLFTFDRTAFTARNSSTAFGVLDVAPHPWGDSFAFAGLAFPDRVLEYYDGASSMSYGDHAAIGDGIRRVAVSGNYGFATASDGDTGQFVSFSLGTTEQGDLVTADTLSSITTGFGSVPENFLIHEGEIAYLASYDGLITVYVDDPTGMSVADRLTMTDEPFDIDGEYFTSSTYYKELLFTASINGNGKYAFIDIADWTDPQVVDSFDTYTATDPSCIVVAGNYLYTVEQGNRVVIYEIGID